MSRTNIEDIYPLSPMQQGMLFHTLYASEGGVYIVQISGVLQGKLDVAAFERAWRAVVDRHPLLRTAFVWEKQKEPLQVVREKVALPIEHQDLRALGADEQAAAVRRFMETDRRRGFTLTKAPLMRVSLLRLGEERHRFVWSSHHLILDGWSKMFLLKEVFALYSSYAQGEEAVLPKGRPFGDYIAWMMKQDLRKAEAFWKKQLDGFAGSKPLALDKAPSTGEEEGPREEKRLVLSESAAAGLQAFARQHKLTLSTLVQGSWALLLSRYSGEDDVCYGATVSGRSAPVPGIEQMVGLFINTIPIRVIVSREEPIKDWLRALQDRQSEAREYEYSPLIKVQEWAKIPRGTPLFGSQLAFENYPVDDSFRNEGKGLTMVDGKTTAQTNYPLTVVAALKTGGRGLTIDIYFDPRRFDGPVIDRMLGHLETLLAGIVEDPERKVGELPFLTADEREEILVDWNDTGVDFPAGARVHALFEARADKTPDAIALVAGGERLTYRALEQRANRLANHLRGLGAGPDKVVGLSLDRSADLVIGLLGVLKSGAAYLPLDPAHPPSRLAQILAESGATLVVSKELCSNNLPSSVKVVRLDTDAATLAEDSDARPDGGARPEDLCYVLFTSGSTGKPKGVCVEHRQLVNYVLGVAQRLGLPPDASYAHVSTFAADLGNTVLFPPLCLGGTLHIVSQELGTDPNGLAAYFHEEGIDCLKIVPSHLSALLTATHPERVLPQKLLVLGGEASSWDLVRKVEELRPGCRIMNHYGPTETTVGVITHAVEPGQVVEGAPIVPLGRPLPNSRIYLLDRSMQPVLPGVPGEVFIGGAGVARGYVNRPDLTAERFVPDPFAGAPARMYRTGDRARFLPDGTIVFLGRADDQVKIRGYRIELGEIEGALLACPGVKEAVVLCEVAEGRPDDKRIVAYLVSSAHDVAELRRALDDKLPDYMIPSAFVFLDALPLTPNGKIDRLALLARAPTAAEHGAEGYVAPRGQVEEMLHGIWADVFGKEKIGVHERFADLGGHSLLAIQIIARTRDAFQVQLPLRAIFEAPTIAALAAEIEAAIREEAGTLTPPIVKIPRDRPLRVSFAQERLWFVDQLESDNAAYHVSLALRLIGRLDADALARALAEIVRRHEVLRTTFTAVNGKPFQIIHPPPGPALAFQDFSGVDPAEREPAARKAMSAEYVRPFDLAAGPLFRQKLFRLSEEDHVVLLTMHHIVTDAWTRSILNRELAALYGAFTRGEPSPLPELPIQYADFSEWQRSFLSGEVLDRHLAYWKQQLEGAPATIELPTDRPRPPVLSFRGAILPLSMSHEVHQGLLQVCRREGTTLFMVLFAAYSVLLHRYSGQTDLSVGTPVLTRTKSETEGLIGFFVNTLVLRARLTPELPFLELLAKVREVCVEGYAHQDMPFERLVQELAPERDPGRTPLFHVLFTVLNAPSEAMTLPGLTLRTGGQERATAKFDLSLGFWEGPNGLAGAIEYSTDLFDAATIQRMITHLRALLEGIAAAPSTPVAELPILGEDERNKLLSFRGVATDFPRESGLPALFEAIADAHPDAVAARYDGREITYRELDRRATKLARHLRDRGVTQGAPVGLYAPRSIDMIVAMLGILKAGGAYVPLDPDFPVARLGFMMKDAAIQVIVASVPVDADLPLDGVTVVKTHDHAEAIAAEDDARLALPLSGEDLAYVLYTSGSTGVPKGVCVLHRNIARLVIETDYVTLGPGDRIAQAASSTFDAATFEIWGALLTGAAVVGVPKDTALSPHRFADLLRAEKITTLFLTTALFNGIIRELPSAFHTLDTVLFGGEAVDPQVVIEALREGPKRLLHVYGPTETTTFATWHHVEHVPLSAVTVPIGQALANTRLHVLDGARKPCPIGVRGELYIGGDGVARGYLNRPELTAERFIQSPFDPKDRLYRTGDIVRWLPEGALEFVGRVDHQVKIRGYRIELGEIEAVLARHPEVRESIVIPWEYGPGDKRLVAYLVPNELPGPSSDDLKSFLEGELPDYMVPTAFVTLEAFPLNENGKINRKALPDPESVNTEGEGTYVAPRGPVEEVLAGIFADVLKLPIERVGARDGFFELGGHSLMATQVIARIRDTFHVDLHVRTIFDEATLADLAMRVDEAMRAEHGIELPPLYPMERPEEIPLSFAQERLWFLDQLDPGNAAYHIPLAIRLEGPLDIGALDRALKEVVYRHEALRTTFTQVGDRPVAVIHEQSEITLSVARFPEASRDARIEAARKEAVALVRAPFDLEKGPLLRARLFVLGPNDHALVIAMHHIIADGWSLGVLNRELGTLYAAFRSGRPAELPELQVQYADYAIWQREWMTGEIEALQLAYWTERLSGAPAAIDLPTDRPRPPVPSLRGARKPFTFPADLAQGLKELSRAEGVTLFMVMLAAFDVLLHRYTGQDDIVVGSPIANRGRMETEGLIGFFVNTLVLRNRISGEQTYKELLHHVKDTCLGAYAHENLPFERLVAELSPTRDMSRSPLFQVMLVLQNVPEDAMSLPGLKLSSLGTESVTAKFDLLMAVVERGSALGGSLEYATDLYDPETIDRLLVHFETLLRSIVASPDRKVKDLSLLPESERSILLDRWRGARTDYPRDASIHQIFGEQAAATPHAVALSAGGRAVSYQELDARSNQLAHLLRERGVAPGAPVGLYLRRSPETFVAILGVLKAGGAYMPLDPDYPASRLAWMIEDAGLSLVLAAGPLPADLGVGAASVIDLSAEAGALSQRPTSAPPSVSRGDSLAYLMYTSGSTGTPKGVCVPHRAVVRLVKQTSYAHFGEDVVFLQLAPLAFDASTLEIWGPLLNGGRLAIFPPERPTLEQIGQVIAAEGVNSLWLTAGLYNAMIDASPEGLRPLKQLLVGGEALSPAHIHKGIELLPGVRIINGYGPTEGTTFSVCHTITEEDARSFIPIGFPIANTFAYVLDEQRGLAPIGVPGELYVGGDGLGLGYLSRPELTAERFVESPFEPGARLYRTGDWVRYRADGALLFLGRRDQQVKLRGHRIELGEIEAVLAKHPALAEVVVVMREDNPGDKRLAAYLVAREVAPAAAELAAFLREKLPEHMIPSAFVSLDAMPLTENGKVDRAALPVPAASLGEATQIAPSTPIEEMLAGIFAEVLGLPQVGAEDDFFALGGHSLLATTAISRIRAAFGVELPLRAMFEAPTPAALAIRIEGAQKAGHGLPVPPITRAPEGQGRVLSFGQERLWFLAELDPDDPSYLLPFAVRLEGKLDRGALLAALRAVAARHEVLRTTYPTVDGKAEPVVCSELDIAMPVVDLGDLAPDAREAAVREAVEQEARQPFDLATGPLVRARLFALGAEEHVLFVTLHHIASDGWSTAVLIHELTALYSAFSEGKPSPLPELPIQYADYAAWQRRFLSGAVLDAQIAYWEKELQGMPQALDLPADHPRPPVQSHRGARATFTLQKALIDEAESVARREQATLFMVLFAAWAALLHRYTGQDDFAIGSPIAGRAQGETEKLIGFFVNTLVLRARVSGDLSFLDLVRRVKETCLGAYAHQDLPFERLVQRLAPERDMSRAPLFQGMFTLQNTPEASINLPSLRLRSLSAEGATAKFDLSLTLTGGPEGMLGSLVYATDLFEPGTIERMKGHFSTLLLRMLASPDRPIAELSMMEEHERAQVVEAWNATHVDYPAGTRLHELFEVQARKTPDATAVVFEQESLSYRALDEQANRLANALKRLGVGPDTLVGVCMDRSIALVIALFGVLKAGGAYVPLDPSYPRDRLDYMIVEAKAKVILTEERLLGTLPAGEAHLLALDTLSLDAESASAPPCDATEESLAYVLFTSGSTGRPKGAMIPHRAIVNHMRWMASTWPLDAHDAVFQKTPMSFDASVWEFYAPLMAGARLVLARPDGHRDPGYLVSAMIEHKVTVLQVVPSLLELVCDVPGLERVTSLRLLYAGGEALQRALVERVWDTLPRPEIINLYGPTECTIDSTYGVSDRRPTGAAMEPIGRPIANMQAYVLDARLAPAPIGVPGELCLAGAGVGRGYLGQPDLTAERFVPNPFGPGSLYKTGDLCRYLPSGALEYLGRVDQQVKVRGYRIELGEIESVLAAHPGIQAAVAIVREDIPGERRLVAYLVPSGDSLSVAELRSFLRAKLPDYMVPAAFVWMMDLPLLASGKVDRRALPAPDEARPDLDEEYEAPSKHIEAELAAIWASVLRLPKVGIHDNFFALGGDSILSIQIVSRAAQAGIRLTPRQVFQHQTIAELAEVASHAVPPASAEQGLVTGPVPLTPIQRWFFEQKLTAAHHYNQSFLLVSRDELVPSHVEAAVSALLEHHDALALRFTKEDGKIAAHIAGAEARKAAFEHHDLTGHSPGEQAAAIEKASSEAQASLDLAHGPLVRVLLFSLGKDRKSRLFVAVHHLAVDGVSWRVLLDDLSTVYGQIERGIAPALPPKTTSFKQWAERLAAHAQSEEVRGELAYWLADARRKAPRFPVDTPDVRDTQATAHPINVALEAEETQALLHEVPKAYRTQINDALLAALLLAFKGLTGEDALQIDLEGHGREELFPDVDLTRTVGWFTTLYPVRLQLDDDGPGSALKAVKEQLRAVPGRGIGYGLLRYLGGAEAERLAALPRSEVIFNYLGQLDQALAEDAHLRPSREASGKPRSPDGERTHLLEVSAKVTGGRMVVTFTYGEKAHRRETVSSLADGFLASLRAIIEHCQSPEAGGYTPSDFRKRVSQATLNKLAALSAHNPDDDEEH
ncbi:MAG: non-ribosomal peptide synthase/polyketide synthase [Byssovorax sp.]